MYLSVSTPSLNLRLFYSKRWTAVELRSGLLLFAGCRFVDIEANEGDASRNKKLLCFSSRGEDGVELSLKTIWLISVAAEARR